MKKEAASTVETATPEALAATSDEATLDFSFVFFGCNRVGWSPSQPSPSTANVAQLRQTFQDIAGLEQSAGLPAAPRYLFFLGDLVRNEQDDDGQTLTAELAAWQELWSQGPLAGGATTLVPVPGNHEVLASIESPPGSGNYAEIPHPPAYDRWLEWLSAHGYDSLAGNGPTPESDPQDLLARDSSRLTYSFTTGLASGKKAHFVLLDTDGLSTARPTADACLQKGFADSPVPGWIAAHWVAEDVAGAQADPATELVFALGHKPIQAPGGGDTRGRDNILACDEYPLANHFLTTLQGSPKVVAYLTAHAHEWNHMRLGDEPRAIDQIIAGNAGSPLSAGDTFGFTLVRVYTDGKVTATSYDRPAPDPYDDPEGVGPATAGKVVVLRASATTSSAVTMASSGA